MHYLKGYGTEETLQSEPIPGTSQVQNSAGGYAWGVGDWGRLDRFLILGSEGNTYYASERKVTRENLVSVRQCILQDGPKVVSRVVEVSEAGRALKNDPALLILALCASSEDHATRKVALEALPRVARIGTHLFHFAQFVSENRGWGRGLKSAVSNWYESLDIDKLALQVIKYQQRDGWSHRDLLRLSHPKTSDTARNSIYKWVVDSELTSGIHSLIEDFQKAQEASSEGDLLRILSGTPLPLECIPTQFRKSPKVWEVLAPTLGLTALIRNLGNMSASGFLRVGNYPGIQVVTSKLTNYSLIGKSRVHPIAFLSALCTYSSGMGLKGSNTWSVVPDVVEALNEGFYRSFGNVEPTGKRLVLAIDVSGSMGQGQVAGVLGLTPRMCSAAMALVNWKVEGNVSLVSFQERIVPLDISRCSSLDDVMNVTNRLRFGPTDCAAPMLWALKNRVPSDAFVIYTDSETWCGNIHPSQALHLYRKSMGLDPKLVVVGMVSNEFSIADPNNPRMLDVVGFDTATPELVSQFISGC